MRKTTLVIIATSIVAAPAAFADSSSREENIGVGSGAVIGAIAGGPVGFFIGAAVGARIGDTMRQKNDSIDSMSASLDSANKDLQLLNRSYDSLSAQFDHLQQVSRPELVGMLQAGIAMDLLFRTDEHALTDTTGNRLASLAATLATLPELKVQLDGFADERGDASYNHALSAQRVEFVREQLLAAGIHPSRIQSSAHGEAPAQDTSPDSYALERRVSLTLFIDDAQSVAQIPN